MGLIALRKLKYGDGYLQPGDPIPEDLMKRPLHHYIKLGHIGHSDAGQPVAPSSARPEPAPAADPDPEPAAAPEPAPPSE